MILSQSSKRNPTFREFDEDDLDSYLEGSLISERLTLGDIGGDGSGGGGGGRGGVPYTRKELLSSLIGRHDIIIKVHDIANNVMTSFIFWCFQPNYRDYSRLDGKGVTTVSRPGSPGPVAGAGDVINTPHGFTIQLDVKLFSPDDIKVVLTDDMLCVSGERVEEGSGGQTLKRSFARKYCIPSDIQLDSIRSHLNHHGTLIITYSTIVSALKEYEYWE
ncbi:Hsp20/alpha crystallin family protein [Dictyocaulus viviparus]|uniref:Hsp20/alpha crystallin family protein n=1 Tax=Dictyocaulus viviparus TaxID=29172 RepID=A0A0D8Y6P8_DICVI|nr:Hsp20/alpha crystallin family protein [Dictyocaulus viviparus]